MKATCKKALEQLPGVHKTHNLLNMLRSDNAVFLKFYSVPQQKSKAGAMFFFCKPRALVLKKISLKLIDEKY